MTFLEDKRPMFDYNKIGLWRMFTVVLLLVASTGCENIDNSTSTKSHNCKSAFKKLMTAANSGIGWAEEMLDANGKPQTGIKGIGLIAFEFQHNIPFGSLIIVGNYDQCLEVKTTENFGTLYCRVHLQTDKFGAVTLPEQRDVFVDICAPDVCAGEDLSPFIEQLQYIQGVSDVAATFKDTRCFERHTPLTFWAKITIFVLAVIIALVAIGTFYDFVVIHDMFSVFGDRSHVKPTATSTTKNGGTCDDGQIQDINETMKNTSTNPGTFGQLLLPFSLSKNMSDVLSTRRSSGDIGSIPGIRFLSLIWIIFGHIHGFGGVALENTLKHIEVSEPSLSTLPMSFLFLTVDNFFVLSGILLSYKVMRELRTKKPSLDYFKGLYFHRFWRLSPIYLIVMVILVTLFIYTSDGPFWPQEVKNCETWWKNLLYISNFEDYKTMCTVWTWSISMDMQFFVISPLILLPVYYYGVRGLSVALGMLLVSVLVAGGNGYVHNLTPIAELFTRMDDHMNYHYFNPFVRIAPYLVGMITGYFLYKTDQKAKPSKPFFVFGWITSFGICYCIFIAIQTHQFEQRMSLEMVTLFLGLIRSGWGIVMSWVVFACTCGYGGIVNRILSWKGFIPISTISYATVLTHPLVIQLYFLSRRRLFYMNGINYVFAYLGIVTASFLVGLVMYLLFEAPFTKLEKAIRRIRDKSKTKVH